MVENGQNLRPYEWPTWILIGGIYGGFAMVSYFHQQIPVFLLPLVGGWFVCWHSQLQHECIHGHPTRWQLLNDLVCLPSLWLWLPYPIYARSHRRHHATDDLTVPDLDPESFYWTEDAWRRAGRTRRLVVSLNQSLSGRLLLGPFLSLETLARQEIGMLTAGDFSHLRYWLCHLIAIAPLLYWLTAICDMSILKYLACFALPGTSLALIRSFCEHLPEEQRRDRTRSVEDRGPLAWLFLFNNLHVLHHRLPALPWYALPSIYYGARHQWLNASGSRPLANYGEVFRR